MMKSLKAIVCAMSIGAALLVSTGCGGDPLAKLEEFTDKICECKDKACVDKVNKEMTEWMKANADKAKEPSDSDKEKATKIMARMMECSKKAMTGGGDKAEGK